MKIDQTEGLPWSERVPMLSINPDAAGRDDVARLAGELMHTTQALTKAKEIIRALLTILKLYET